LKKGVFISFEGGDGAGKSTQIKLLAGRLRAHGIQVVETREPGGTPEGEAIRDLLVTGDPKRWDGLSEALLNLAARKRHVEVVIKPALAKGKWVLSDRFADSTMAYQGIVQGVGADIIKRLHELVIGPLTPALTIVLDLDPTLGLARSNKRHFRSSSAETRYEKMGPKFHRALRAAFRQIAKANRQRCVLLDASKPEVALADAVWKTVAKRFKL
jgi:dTMP kinase